MDTGIQTYKSVEEDYIGDYVVPEDEKIERVGISHFETVASHYLSRYVNGDCSIEQCMRSEERLMGNS